MDQTTYATSAAVRRRLASPSTRRAPYTVSVPRRGFSYLELQVSFVLFAISMVGLAPLTVVQSRQMQAVEQRFPPDPTHYLTPSDNAWAQKVGAAATLSDSAPTAKVEPVLLVDDGDLAYTQVNYGGEDWIPLSSLGFQGDCWYNAFGGGGDTAVWQFSGLLAGTYDVLVTYESDSNYNDQAKYEIYEGGVKLADKSVDQRQVPDGPTLDGVPWKKIGTVTITGDRLRVELEDGEDGKIIADAARLVPYRNDLEVTAFTSSTDNLTASATVHVTDNQP